MPRGKAGQFGLTLIELMIAMALGLIVAAAAVALFATNKLTYTATENIGRIQESGRVAFELMSRDLRDAGGIPCDSSLAATMQNGLNGSTTQWWTNWDNGLRGYGPTTAFTAPVAAATGAFGTTAEGNRVSGTDAIELKSADPTSVMVSADVSNANRSAPLPVNNVTGLQSNDLIVVCDFYGGTLFQATGFTGTTILHAGGAGSGGSPGNIDATLDLGSYGNDKNGVAIPAISMNAFVAIWRASRWYVGCNLRVACDQPGGRSLYQVRVSNVAGTYTVAADEIATGVQDMNVQYLVAGNSSYIDDESTLSAANWRAVTAMKITLTIGGSDRVGTDGNTVTRTVQHVITLRNRLP